MDIATDDEGRCLLDTPQPLGFLPTLRFWKDRENWRLVGWGFAVLATVTNVVLMIVAPPPLLGGVIAFSVMVLANGLLEKYIRRKALKRRQLLASAALDALSE